MSVNEQASDILSQPVREFLSATAAKTPTPGGGSVAGLVGALGAGLAEMALNYTRGKKAFTEHADLHAHLAERLARMRGMFEQLVTEDIQAYGLYSSAGKMEAGVEKDEAMELALAAAIDVPREMSKLALALLKDVCELADKCTPHLIGDLKGSAALALAVERMCHDLVCSNAAQLTDPSVAHEIRTGSRQDLDRALELLDRIEQLTSTD